MAAGATRKSSRTSKSRLVAGIGHAVRVLVGFSCGLALLAATGLAARELSRLPVERVLVSGDLRRVSRERLQEMVTESLRGGFLWADLEVVRQPLEDLPWVFRVVVKRKWPSSLEIHVTEQLPIARWGSEGYLNHEGEVYTPPVMEESDDLPLLAGPPASQLLLMQHYMFMQEQLALVQLQVRQLTMNERGGLRAMLSNGSELVLGRGQMKEKIARYLGVYHADEEFREGQVRRVDLRYPHGLAVAWDTPGPGNT